MILSLETQVKFFLWMVVLGGALGLVYDGLRILRSVVPHNEIALQVEDGVYWLCAAFYSFWVILQKNAGEMRFFVILGLFGGMILYFSGLSHGVRWIGEGILQIIGKIVRVFLEILCTPFRLVYWLIAPPMQRIGRFCEKKRKKYLCFCKNYAKIKIIKLRRDWNAFAKRGIGFGKKQNGQTTTTKKDARSKRKT